MYMSVSPDQLVAAGAYVARRWGDYGYRFTEITTPAALVSVFTVRCSDGSQMRFAVDRWSNIAELSDDPEAGTATADPSAAASRDASPERQTNAT